ncbi:MAG: AmmeMemoRadiSam system protein B [Syntrophus sp. (in: bacteria)]|nr:AmmeMemoRadiSam system protein B [Syntrophus sp. (in: bacteria)]
MENPRVRWIEAHPVIQDGQELILLRDTEGIVENALLVSRAVAFMISLMDGTRTLRDIQTAFMEATGELVYIEKIQELVDTMDSHLLLFSENFRNYYTKLKEEYERSPVRKAFLAGKSYSANRMDLLAFLDEMLGNEKDGKIDGEITGIVAPHIDYARGIDVYKKTYPYLRNVSKPLIVIFGTCHYPTEQILSISCKDLETPIEIIHHAKELDRLILGNEVLKNYVDEWPHRNEHSIELQLPLIQFMVQHDFEVLSILTGSMHEYVAGEKSIDAGEIDELVANLKQVLRDYGEPFIILSGADLAHIGAQFGDNFPLDTATLARSKAHDEMLLESVKKVDAKGFFESIKEEGDARRICGLTPIFFQLKLLEKSSCTIVGYDQWTDGNSSVSFAGGVFYK